MSIAGLIDKSARCWERVTCCRGRGSITLILLIIAFAWPAHAQAQSVETHGAQSPAVSTTGNVAISYGFTAEQVQSLVKAARAGDADKIASLSGKLDVTQGAALTMLRIIGQQDVPFEKLPEKLAEIAEQYKSAMKRLAGLDPQDPTTRALIARANAAIKSGQLDEADGLLNQAGQADLDAAREAQRLAREALAAADRHFLQAAANFEVRGNIAMTRLHYLDAAQEFEQAVDLVPAGHPDEKGRFLLNKAQALFLQGDERGDNLALANSIAAYRLALREYTRERVPLRWAMAQNGLGNALITLGARERGTSTLKEAVETYLAALEVDTRDSAPLDWATTETNLGNALQRLGERESGTASLKRAVAAYRAALGVLAPYYAALEEDTRNRLSWTTWAIAQMNLGAALQTLGEREGGTGRLKEALAAYRAALKEYTRDQAPLQWALTLMNLGNVLRTLGELEGSASRLEEAVVSYRAALEECTRDRVPLDWAATENNLGTVLRTLGEVEGGTARFEEAATAYRAALQEFTRERTPLQWAMTQNNLGIALKALGEQESGTARLEEAVTAYRAALEEYTPDTSPLQWALTQMNLGNALLRLGERENGTAGLEQAVVVYHKALEVIPMPVDQAKIQFNLGIALSDLGNRTHSTASLKEAFASFRQACAVFRAAGMLQLSVPCERAIIPLRDQLEPGPANTNEPSKPAG